MRRSSSLMKRPGFGLGLGRVSNVTGLTSFVIEWWHPSPLYPIEHNARALLLGRWYNPVHHDYRYHDPLTLGPPIDADTLEVIHFVTKYNFELFKANNGLTIVQLNMVQDAAQHGSIVYPERGPFQ